MQYGFDQLKGEYEQLFALMRVERPATFQLLAKCLVATKSRFINISQKTGVPIVLLMALNEREDSNSFNAYLGDGENLHHVTHMVPAGRGPFATWDDGALDALTLEHMTGIAAWTWPMLAYYGERWNGWGYRMHGKHSAYLWAGSNVYTGGKYETDGNWNHSAFDTQPGIIPLMRAIVALDPALDVPGWPAIPAPQPAPQEHVPAFGTDWIQSSLNRLDNAGLAVDGSDGRLTRTSISNFQRNHGLPVDGIAGPLTVAAIGKALVNASS